MPLECAFKQRHGRQFCVTDCPASAPCGTFEYVRVERPEDVPAADPHAIDVAVLDMNHGWPNLGHDSLVHAVMDSSCETIGALEEAGLRVRVLSFDVRRSGVLPEGPGGRYSLYVGTGGPGHIDPRAERRCRAIRPGRAREPRLGGAGLPALRRDPRRARTRRSSRSATRSASSAAGRARPSRCCAAPRRASARGVLENVLAWPAGEHPWFRRFAELLGPSARLRVVENRLFDLIPRRGPARPGPSRIGFETLGVGGEPGDAVTMIEFARDRGGVMPRDVRGEPPPRDRGPLPAGHDPEPEARPGRGDATSGTASASRSSPARSPRRTSTRGCTSPRTSRSSGRCASTCSGRCGSGRSRSAGPTGSTRTGCSTPCSASRSGAARAGEVF